MKDDLSPNVELDQRAWGMVNAERADEERERMISRANDTCAEATIDDAWRTAPDSLAGGDAEQRAMDPDPAVAEWRATSWRAKPGAISTLAWWPRTTKPARTAARNGGTTQRRTNTRTLPCPLCRRPTKERPMKRWRWLPGAAQTVAQAAEDELTAFVYATGDGVTEVARRIVSETVLRRARLGCGSACSQPRRVARAGMIVRILGRTIARRRARCSTPSRRPRG